MASRPNRLNVDMQGYKADWLAYCDSRRVSPSQALRQMVAAALADADGGPLRPVRERSRAKIRKELRFTALELARAEQLARTEGFSLTHWMIAVIISRLESGPLFGQDELTILAQSNLQLRAIGRNLNQLAKAAHQGIDLPWTGRPDLLEQLADALQRHTTEIAAHVSANVARWRRA
jgi:hypothetical protein